jgi:DNA-binding NarL/FixJ family response regulator
MKSSSQFDWQFLQSLIEELGLAVEELRASNRELKSILDHTDTGSRSTQPEAPSPRPKRLPDDLSLAQLRSEVTRLHGECREAIRESLALRSRSREARQAAPVEEPGYGGKALSKREREVLSLMVEGKSSKEVAAALGISFKTAVTHRASIMSKLNVHEIASVVREAIRRGLV